MRGYEMRWIGRARPCLPIFRHEHRQPFIRHISSQPQSSKSYRWALLFLGSTAAAFLALRGDDHAKGSGGGALNKSTFTPFTVTSKEQVSPTAFILAVRPASNALSSSSPDADAVASAWRHGLWSVEIKQPQLQIARHYTPLPPSPSPSPPPLSPSTSLEAQAKGGEDGDATLRFLIRRMDGGEMSTYLSKQHPGDTIWLRGPHLGFDIAQRLGSAAAGGELVFLAGGTGVAPALQIAHRLLDPPSPSTSPPPVRVTILWANRRSADALGCPAPPHPSRPWRFALWSRAGPDPPARPPSSSLARHLLALQRAHPGRFRVSHHVDEEGSFVEARDLEAVVCPSAPAPASASCPWHSPAAAESLPSASEEDDLARGDCVCVEAGAGAAARKLLCVSGPDGFVGAYAGAKRWRDGRETQGVLEGVLGDMRKRGRLDGWMVLKL